MGVLPAFLQPSGNEPLLGSLGRLVQEALASASAAVEQEPGALSARGPAALAPYFGGSRAPGGCILMKRALEEVGGRAGG